MATKNLMSACLIGHGPFANKSYFFKDDQYVRYDWPTDRAESGTMLTAPSWQIPAAFATNPDGVLDGSGDYLGIAYFFKGSQYISYDWAKNRMNEGYPRPNSVWGLTGKFTSIDSCLNGQLAYSSYAYFFKGNQYMRFDWVKDRMSDGYPLPLTEWGLKGDFANGIDACVNGIGSYKGVAYFFKNDQYVRYNWATGKVETSPKEIVGNWPGLHEWLAVGMAKNEASRWLAAAQAQVIAYQATLQKTIPFPSNKAIFEKALSTHFHIESSWPISKRNTYLSMINQSMLNIKQQLSQSVTLFRTRTNAQAIAEGGTEKDEKTGQVVDIVKAYYTPGDKHINFTENFVREKTGPKYQAAIIIHEAVHAFDPQSGKPTIHIPEWFESGAKTKDLPKYYFELTADEAVHNPSSYAAFSQHIYFQEDRRYGGKRPFE